MNIPNSITLARIALAPLFVYLLLISPEPNSWQQWLATFVFVFAISTDGIDGAVARRTGKVTNLGKIVTLYRVMVVKNRVIAAAGSGKLKTVLQGVAIGVVLAPFEVWVPFWSFVEEGLMLVALASTLISGVQFFVAAIKK